MTGLRVLTVRQPWAWAIIHGGKDVENRTRNVAGDYRGPVAIQVSLKDDDAWEDRVAAAFIGRCPDERARWHNRYVCDWCVKVGPLVWRQQGHVIGVVNLVDVHTIWSHEVVPSPGLPEGFFEHVMCSPWAEPEARVHLRFANPRPLTEPMPFRGALHLQRVTAEVEAEILRRVA